MRSLECGAVAFYYIGSALCLIGFLWQPDQPVSLVLVSNRDEFHSRPTEPLSIWPETPGGVRILAGRDMQAMGTWLAFSSRGRWAAVTNLPVPDQAPGGDGLTNKLSRGNLVSDWVAQDLQQTRNNDAYSQNLRAHRQDYAPFTLICGEETGIRVLCSKSDKSAELASGAHATANRPFWSDCPRSENLQTMLAQLAHEKVSLDDSEPLVDSLTKAMRSPVTDLTKNKDTKTLGTCPFILSPDYGTRCTTVAFLTAHEWQVCEFSYHPDGELAGQASIRLRLEADPRL